LCEQAREKPSVLFAQSDKMMETQTLRLVSHWPAVIPEPNPKTKKAILTPHETSSQNINEKATAKTKNMIDRPIRELLDFILIPP
jgi:hypothetical protein